MEHRYYILNKIFKLLQSFYNFDGLTNKFQDEAAFIKGRSE